MSSLTPLISKSSRGPISGGATRSKVKRRTVSLSPLRATTASSVRYSLRKELATRSTGSASGASSSADESGRTRTTTCTAAVLFSALSTRSSTLVSERAGGAPKPSAPVESSPARETGERSETDGDGGEENWREESMVEVMRVRVRKACI